MSSPSAASQSDYDWDAMVQATQVFDRQLRTVGPSDMTPEKVETQPSQPFDRDQRQTVANRLLSRLPSWFETAPSVLVGTFDWAAYRTEKARVEEYRRCAANVPDGEVVAPAA